MGEIADMIIEGTMCPCGAIIDGGVDGPGFMQYCSPQCERDYGTPAHEFEGIEISNQRRFECDHNAGPDGPCRRRFKSSEALAQHRRDKHGV